MTALVSPPINPFAAPINGGYADGTVRVQQGGPVPAVAARTASFATWIDRGVVNLAHWIPAAEIDNDVAGRLAGELFATGWVAGDDTFERLMTGVILTSAESPESAWTLFYRNTLARLARLAGDVCPSAGTLGGAVEGSLADYAPVYERALNLTGPGSVLELGSCFGFLSLLLARARPTTASDVTRNTMRLLASVAPRLGITLDTLVCDAARVPRVEASYDTVIAVHLLEHLAPDHGFEVIAEMQRLAARRVVVAVPFEDEPTAAYGHVRAFDIDQLGALGDEIAKRDAGDGWLVEVSEHHGGWLVLDRC